MQPTTPGTVMEDDQHNKSDTNYLVIIEAKRSSNLRWLQAYVNNREYKVIATKLSSPTSPGMYEGNSDTILIRSKQGNILWQLSLEKELTNPIARPVNTGIALRVKANNKINIIRIKSIKTLRTEHYM